MSRSFNSRKGKTPRHPQQADNRLLKAMRRLKPGRPQDEDRLERMALNKTYLELEAWDRRCMRALGSILGPV